MASSSEVQLCPIPISPRDAGSTGRAVSSIGLERLVASLTPLAGGWPQGKDKRERGELSTETWHGILGPVNASIALGVAFLYLFVWLVVTEIVHERRTPWISLKVTSLSLAAAVFLAWILRFF